jgi:hypothetical protein
VYSPSEKVLVKCSWPFPSHQPFLRATECMFEEKRKSSGLFASMLPMTKALETMVAWSGGMRCAAHMAPPVELLSASTWKMYCSLASDTRIDSPPTTGAVPQKPYFSAIAPISKTALREVRVRSAARRESSYIASSAVPFWCTGAAYVRAEHVDSPKESPCSLLIA